MMKLQQLIQDMCPNGVEFKKLGEVCELKRGSGITESQAIEGNIPVIAGGQKPAYYHNQSNREGQNITVAGSGAYAGYVAFWEQPIFVSDAFTVTPKDTSLDIKFVYYFLKNIQTQIHNTKKGSGVPHVHPSSISDFEIPLPPLEIQKKIVECLDKFSALAAELQAELQMRRKQYEYYRTQLLTPHSDCNSADKTDDAQWEWKTLGEVCIPISNIKWKETIEEKEFYYIDLTSVNRENRNIETPQTIKKANAPSRAQQIIKHEDILFGTTRPTLQRYCYVPLEYTDQICSTGYCVLRANKNKVLPKWIYYQLSLQKFINHIENNQSGAAYPSISDSAVKSYQIPLPSLAEQARIVAILDKFEALTTSLSDGIPAEQAAQQKRYEYYRDLLLTFDRKEV